MKKRLFSAILVATFAIGLFTFASSMQSQSQPQSTINKSQALDPVNQGNANRGGGYNIDNGNPSPLDPIPVVFDTHDDCFYLQLFEIASGKTMLATRPDAEMIDIEKYRMLVDSVKNLELSHPTRRDIDSAKRLVRREGVVDVINHEVIPNPTLETADGTYVGAGNN